MIKAVSGLLLLFCGTASATTIITSGTAWTIYNSAYDYFGTNIVLQGPGVSLNVSNPLPAFRIPDLSHGMPGGFNFEQQYILGSSYTINALEFNGTSYGAGYRLVLELDFSGPVVTGPKNCTQPYWDRPLFNCTTSFYGPFTMSGFFRITNNQGSLVVNDFLAGQGNASASAADTMSGLRSSVSYAFTSPEPGSLGLLAVGSFCIVLGRFGIRWRRL